MNIQRKASEVFKDILGGKKQKWNSIFSEILEMLEALFRGNIDEFKLELEQVVYALQMQLYQTTDIDFYLQGCENAVEGFYDRRCVWLEIFARYNVPFENKYLEYGSNYRRAYKIKKALGLAGVYVSTIDALALCEEFSNK